MSKQSERQDLDAILADALQGAPVAPGDGLSAALRDFRVRTLAAAAQRFPNEEAGVPCSRFLSSACDLLVQQVATALTGQAEEHVGKLRVAWVATGGYGRGLMSPGSTVRLVLLHDSEEPDAARALAQQAVAQLRSAGVHALSAAHTVAEALGLMRDDSVAALGMVDTRLVVGDKGLYRLFTGAVTDRFLPDCWGSFAEDALRECLSPRDPITGSPYCTEPNLKDGAGCLRDIGTAQKVNACLQKVPGLEQFHDGLGPRSTGLLSRKELADLQDALDFVLRVRNKLHLLQRERSDVLHRGVRAELAASLGFTDGSGQAAATRLMRELFRRTGCVARVLMALNERFSHVHRVAWRRAGPSPPRDLGDGFTEVEGRIHSATRPPFRKGEDPGRLMRLFRLSQRRHLTISQELLGQVAAHLSLVDDEFRADSQVGAVFLDLLAGSVGVADRVGWMRDCGLLQAYLPEFAPLLHLTDHKPACDYTLDEHAIEALRVIDELGHTRERSELAQCEVLEQVKRPDLLRLAILLHDMDRAGEPEGPQTAAGLAARIGLKRNEREDLLFLLRSQRMLWQHAENRSFESPATAEDLARSIGSAERLRGLYLMTYAHARAAGPLGWFAWRDAQLYELYQVLMAVLVPHYTPFATADYFERELEELAEKANVVDRARQFVSLVPELYKTEVSPVEALAHLELMQKTQSRPAAMTWAVRRRQVTVWVCTSDVPARFAQIAGVFTYNGLDILSATAFTLADATVLDRFIVQTKGRPINPDPAYWQKIEQDLVDSIRGSLDVGRALTDRSAPDRDQEPISSRRAVTTVHFDNESSNRFTILDIMTGDRPGLLFDIAEALGALGLNIELARIRTRGELAQDVFYLTDSKSGQQITGTERLHEVRERLVEAATVPAPSAAE